MAAPTYDDLHRPQLFSSSDPHGLFSRNGGAGSDDDLVDYPLHDGHISNSSSNVSSRGSLRNTVMAGIWSGGGKGGSPNDTVYGDADMMEESEEYLNSRTNRRRYLREQRRKHGGGLVGCRLGLAFIIALVSATGSVVLYESFVGRNRTMARPAGHENHRMAKLLKHIVDAGVSAESSLNRNQQPQSQAAKWIAWEDGADIPLNDPLILQRYALAVLYYSSFGSNRAGFQWHGHDAWLTDANTCDWQGVECFHENEESKGIISALRLRDSDLVGGLPIEVLFALKDSLVVLDLSENQLEGPLPSELGVMTKLRFLSLQRNRFTSTVPESIGQLSSQLRELALGRNLLTGALPDSLGDLAELRILELQGNTLEGQLPEIASMSKLSRLNMEDNQFSGSLPQYLHDLKELADLRAGRNKFSGKLPAQLAGLPRLQSLHLNDNELTGEIPDIFDQLRRLSEIELQNNHFRGGLPESLGHLRTLKRLHLSHNKITGTLPRIFSLLVDLRSLFLDHNHIRGEVPTALGYLDDVVDLSLHGNQLSGAIPTEIGTCFRLKTLDLANNTFSGGIPSELGGLDELTRLNLAGNSFQNEEVPGEICNLDELQFLAADCKNSSVKCTCCHKCF